MQLTLVMHHLYMKAITFIILNFLTCVCFSQSRSFMENLEFELNPIAHQVLEKDRKLKLIFRLDSLDEVQFYQNNDRNLVDSQQVKLIIQSKKDSLAKNKLYELYFFRDSISDTTFSNYEINEAGTFGGYYDIPASYPGGINAFLHVLQKEISNNIDRDRIDFYDWNKAISFIVDKYGKLKFIEDNNLISLVDSTKLKKWQPAIKYGRPVPQYFTTEPINKVKFLFENQYRIELYSYDVLYPSFKGYPIIISDDLIKEGNYQTIISFVSAKGLFEPHIIKGTTKNATELINFIKSKGMEHPSFLPHFPGRVYVYYK